MRKNVFGLLAIGLVMTACSGEGDGDEARDLTLASADSVAAISDTATAEPTPEPRLARPAPSAPEPAPARRSRPSPPTIAAGTTITLAAGDTLTSRHNQVGDTIAAMAFEPVLDSQGREVIPAGALFWGTITDIAPAESPGGEGRMSLAFTLVEIDGQSYPLEVGVDSLATHMKGRGVTAGDAAKVGAGAVVGAVAGRIIGGNRRGTIVGAAAGAAAGVGIAAATRDIDILLDAGAPIYLRFTGAFTGRTD